MNNVKFKINILNRYFKIYICVKFFKWNMWKILNLFYKILGRDGGVYGVF